MDIRVLSADLGLETAGVETDERGFITVDAAWQTTAEGVHAIGDVIGGALLAYKASDEGVACVERIVTGAGHVNYDVIPNVVYTEPELAMVGRTEAELKEAGVRRIVIMLLQFFSWVLNFFDSNI